MERLLAAATALLAVTTANAADLPKMFLGNWEDMMITQRGYIQGITVGSTLLLQQHKASQP
jgi:hypothetical protein